MLELKIREMVSIDEMQFGFVPGKATTVAIFIARQLQEKFIAAGNPFILLLLTCKKHLTVCHEKFSGGH